MKIPCFLVIFIIMAGGVDSAAARGQRIIENQAFGVFATEGGRVVVSLHNDNCVGYYRVASGKVVVGEGEVDFRALPATVIPFGETDLEVACVAGNRLRVVVR
jgi:hypothetical protein